MTLSMCRANEIMLSCAHTHLAAAWFSGGLQTGDDFCTRHRPTTLQGSNETALEPA